MTAKLSLICGFVLVATMLTADAPTPTGRYSLLAARSSYFASTGKESSVDVVFRLDAATGVTAFAVIGTATNGTVVAVWHYIQEPVVGYFQKSCQIPNSWLNKCTFIA